MTIRVQEVTWVSGQTVAVGHGFDPNTKIEVVFASEARPMLVLKAVIDAGGSQDAEVKPWQVIS